MASDGVYGAAPAEEVSSSPPPRVPTPSVSARRLVRSRRLAPIPVLVIANRNTPATHASCVLTPSTPPPPQTVVDVREVSTRRAMSGWYKRMMSFALLTVASSAVAAVSWRAPTGSTLAVLGTSMAPEDWTSDDRCIVYTYFDEVEGMDDQNEIIESWAKTWSEAGWKPVIIGEVHARRHPRYDEFRARFAAMPTPNPSEYELACYLRHVAMAVVGGGYLADYDTLNVNVPPPPQCGYLPNGGALTVHQEGSFTDFGHKPMRSVVPALTSGNATAFEAFANYMNEVDVGAATDRFNLGMVSDMLFLQYAIENAGDLIRRTHSFIDSVLAVPDPPCDSAGVELPMLFHFSHATMTRNGMDGQPRGQKMLEWQKKLREAKARCAERGATADDDSYAREYFLEPGSQTPAAIALDAFTAVMPCVFYPEMDCPAEFVAQNLAALDASRDAHGNPSTGSAFIRATAA